jgi:PKD repeat protein
MKTYHTILMALFLWSAGQSQTPWTNWDIYRDSTGNGANPISGGLVCASETLWLVVDTNGMGAAGITGWRWRFQGSTPQLVYCPGTGTGCPSSLPDFFPFGGVTNERKLGIKPNSPGPNPRTFMLVVYLPGGDSLVSAKAFQVKGGSAYLDVPTYGCAGSSVPAHVNVTGILDSFVVTYGTTTVRNQTDFSINLPSGTGTLDVILTYYFCGTSRMYNTSINYDASAPSGPSPSVSSIYNCPNSSRQFSVYLPPGYTSFVWKVNGSPVGPGSNHPLTYSWIPPAPATYTISYDATYPSCGTVSGSTSHTVSPAPQPTWSYLDVYPNSTSGGYCPGATPISVTAIASASGGTYTIDIGDDGTIEASTNHYNTMMGSLPPGGLPIRVRFDDGCGGVLDTNFTYNPTLAGPGSYTGSASISIIKYPKCPGDQIEAELHVSYFPEDSVKNIQWRIIDGLNNVVVQWTPSNTRRIQLTIPSNSTPPWTLECQFTANYPPNYCANPPTSPVTYSNISPSVVTLSLVEIGSVCLSGGTVRLTPSGSTSDIDSVQYVLPDTIIMRAVGETLTVNVPAGNYVYPIIYRVKTTTCGYISQNTYMIRAQQTPPAIFVSLGSGSVCPGSPVSIYASISSMTSVDSIVAILWNNSRVPLNMSSPGSARTSVSAPTTAGIYPIRVIGYNCAGNDTTLLTLQVFSGNTAVANFTAPVSACVGVPVTFQRTGTNNGISTTPSWSFGDGGFLRDTAMSITHTYTQPGLYTVRLSLSSLQCGNTSYERTIRVYGAPPTLSGLNVTPSGATISYSVSASDYDVIVWDFGDGNTATGVLSGTHTYASSGSYTVKVEAINACDTTRLSQTVSVTTGLVAKGNDGWLIYPNPASQEVFVAHPTYQGEVRVELYDVTGRLVQAEVLSTQAGRMQLRVPAGLYTLRLINREGVATTKLLVE